MKSLFSKLDFESLVDFESVLFKESLFAKLDFELPAMGMNLGTATSLHSLDSTPRATTFEASFSEVAFSSAVDCEGDIEEDCSLSLLLLEGIPTLGE